MNVDELQSVQSRERQTDSLQQLRESFYGDAGEFIQQLRDERDRAAERADDPFDAPEVNRLTDDINTAEQTVEAIYERRVGKIVKMASLAAADMPTEEDGLTREERDLFETLVGAIENNRDHVLDVLAGEASPGAVATSATTRSDSGPVTDPDTGATHESTSEPTDSSQPISTQSDAETQAPEQRAPPTEPTGTDEDATVGAADVMSGDAGEGIPPEAPPEEPPNETGVQRDDPLAEESGKSPASDGGTVPASPSSDGTDPSPPQSDDETETAVDRRTVRITDDVGEIFGIDQREYDLSTDDVVTLPAENATPLVERDAAEPID